MKLSRNIYETIPSLDDSNPDTFSLILRCLNAIHQTMEPDAGVHHHQPTDKVGRWYKYSS